MGTVVPIRPGMQHTAEATVEASPFRSLQADTRRADMSRVYTCGRCHAQLFKISVQGDVVCGDCDAIMSTLMAGTIK